MKEKIDSFFQSKSIAITGFSRKLYSHSRAIYNSFVEKGFNVYPINPCQEEIDGIKVYPSIDALPSEVDAVYIINNKDLSMKIAQEAAAKGIKKIWIHVKCNSQYAQEVEKKYGLSIVMGECFFMWAEPVKGIHNFHRFVRNLFAQHRVHKY